MFISSASLALVLIVLILTIVLVARNRKQPEYYDVSPTITALGTATTYTTWVQPANTRITNIAVLVLTAGVLTSNSAGTVIGITQGGATVSASAATSIGSSLTTMPVGKDPNLTLLSTVADAARTLHFGVILSAAAATPPTVKFAISYIAY